MSKDKLTIVTPTAPFFAPLTHDFFGFLATPLVITRTFTTPDIYHLGYLPPRTFTTPDSYLPGHLLPGQLPLGHLPPGHLPPTAMIPIKL